MLTLSPWKLAGTHPQTLHECVFSCPHAFLTGISEHKSPVRRGALDLELLRLINCNKSYLFVNLQKFWLVPGAAQNRLRHYVIIATDTLQQIHAQESLIVWGPVVFTPLLTVAFLTSDLKAVT